MNKDKRKENNIDKTKREVLDLKEFLLLKTKEQDEKIKGILNEFYEEKVDITKNMIEKVLNIAFDVSDNEIYLPHSLRIEKIGSRLIFSFKEKSNLLLIILFLLGFFLVGGFATYTGIHYLRLSQLNVDLDGDGVADLNIDLDEDGICDINCDTNKDGKPDRNIDYKGNRKAIFNVQREDGSIFNPINQDTNNDGVCDLNCDTDGDGWPDINIDLDGDGVADLNIDVDGDKVPDINIDTNGDGVSDVNIDNDGDGKCDVNCVDNSSQNNKQTNIDLDGDGKCDINCDTNNDNKPDINIDYAGNKKPTFNVEDENGNIKNKVNQDTNNDGICDINCDTDNDGWPDTNIDLDGDGKPDVNIDTNHDGSPDINIDNNGDGICDMNCDTDGDGVCDSKCAMILTPDNKDGVYEDGNGGITSETAQLIVLFENQNAIVTDNLYPDDQKEPGLNTTVPDLKFSIENTTDEILYYDLNWLISTNTFESTNFWYKVSSTNNGLNKDWTTTPKTDGLIEKHIAIRPHTKQNYTVQMTLHGTGEEQNYDQGKHFKGKIQVVLEK